MSIQAIPLIPPTARTRVDRFVRKTGPQIFRLALQSEGASLLEELMPLGKSRPGCAWRSVVLPLRRHRSLLQQDRADLLRANHGRDAVLAVQHAGSDVMFVESHLPHVAAEARLVARATTNNVGKEIAETVRAAIVVAALSASAQNVGVVPEELIAIDDDVAAFTRPEMRVRGLFQNRALPNLVSAYLTAKEKESA